MATAPYGASGAIPLGENESVRFGRVRGLTGVPIVDAAMRQLKRSGLACTTAAAWIVALLSLVKEF